MSSPQGIEAGAEKFRDITVDAVDQAGDLARQTAQQMDDGEYGLDAATRSMSKFFDIIAKGSAAHFRTAIAGPCFSLGTDEIPAAEEDVDLTQVRAWPRKISIDKPFKDLVRPGVVIPNRLVTLTPLVVPAEAVRFTLKVRLKDTAYFGRNYTARLALTQTTGASGNPQVDYQVVTVAL